MYLYALYIIQTALHLYLIYSLSIKLRENKSLSGLVIFNLSIIGWIILSWLILVNYNQPNVILFVRSTYAITSIALSSFVIFVRQSIKKKLDSISLLIIILSGLTIVLSFTNLLIKDVIIAEATEFVPVVFGDFAFIFIIYFALGILVLLNSVLSSKSQLKGIDVLRLRYITLGMILGGVTALLTNVILPGITGRSDSALLGPLAISIVSIVTTFSYIKNRLFGIKFLVGKLVYYLIIYILPLFFMYLILIQQMYFFEDHFSRDSVMLAFLNALVFIPLYFFIKEKANSYFSNFSKEKRQSPESQRDFFTKAISTKLDLNQLGIITITTIMKYLNIQRGGIVIFKKDDASIMYRALKGINLKTFSVRDLLQVIYYWDEIEHSTVIVRDEIIIKNNSNPRLKRILRFMKSNDIHVILPLNRKVQLNGVVLLGGKDDTSPYTIEDISFMESIIINASIALGRSILYQEVEEFNKVLQQKVDYQTKELQQKVKELQEARRKESDMIDIMGHELRTPATVIKLNVDFLQKFSEHLPKNKGDFLKYVSRIKDAIDTEIRLINTLLTSAKLEGDKIEINAEEVDFTKEIEMALHAEEHLARDKGLKIVNNIPKKIPPVYADHARVSEIFNNLISNAVRYTEKGSVVIDAIEDKKYIKISIKDTGKGISKKDIARLGTKFFRTKTYIQSPNGDNFNIVRPGGTGLGLYVSFGLVEKMGGRIEVQSEINKGSTFSVYLPKYRNQDGHIEKEETKDMFTKLGLK